MKKLLSICICISLVLALNITVFGSEIAVMLDGVELEFDVPPQIINNRTMVPMRVIFETLGADVTWHEASRIIVADIPNVIYSSLQIGRYQMEVTRAFRNDYDEIDHTFPHQIYFDVPPTIVDGRTLVPLRAISETFGFGVNWIAETQTVTITMQSETSALSNLNNRLPFIAIVKSNSHSMLDAARAGFMSGLATESIEFDFFVLSAVGDPDLLSRIANTAVNRNSDLIFTLGTAATIAVAELTDTIPIVFSAVTDPVLAGLVESLERPGRNVTGTSDMYLMPDSDRTIFGDHRAYLESRYYQSGFTAGVMVAKILRGEAQPQDMAIQFN